MSTYRDCRGYQRRAFDNRLVHRVRAYLGIYLKNKERYPLSFRDYQVHHKDLNKENNDVSNLEILTDEEHRKVHGLEYEDRYDDFLY